MSGQMEWVLMFAFGVACAYMVLHLFGITRCFVGACLLGIGSSSQAEIWNITNETDSAIFTTGSAYTVLTDDFGANYMNALSVGWGGDVEGQPVIINAGGHQTFVVNTTGADGVNQSISVAAAITGSGIYGFSVNADNTATHHERIVGSLNREQGLFINYDGQWLGGEAPAGTPLTDPNVPWIPKGTTNDVGVLVTNYYGGIGWGTNYAGVDGRDAFAMQQMTTQAQALSAMLDLETSNMWFMSGGSLTNYANTNVGAMTEWNPWILGFDMGAGWGGMTNWVVNYDPHQWGYYSKAASWSRAAWTLAMMAGFIFIVRQWLEVTMGQAWLIPGQHGMSSVGGFIQAIITSGLLGAAMLAIPLAFEAWVGVVNASSTGTSIAVLFHEDGTQWGLYARYGWMLINEWFPMDLFIGNCVYLLGVRFWLLPLLKNAQFMVLKALTVLALLCMVSVGHAESKFQYGGINTTAYSVSVYLTNNAGGFEFIAIPPNFTPPVYEVPDGIIGVYAVTSTAIQIYKGGIPATQNEFIMLDGFGNLTRHSMPAIAGSGLQVDGVQAFIEGFAMIIPMAGLAWVRKMRRWAGSAATRLDL